jgi:hypothetical protein
LLFMLLLLVFYRQRCCVGEKGKKISYEVAQTRATWYNARMVQGPSHGSNMEY